MSDTPDPRQRWSTLRAAAVARAGGVIAYPTEGVFGLGCRWDDPAALGRLIAVKGRSPGKGVIVIGSDWAMLRPFMADPDRWTPLAQAQGVGSRPVTVLVPAARHLPALLTGGRRTVALRVVCHPLAAELTRRAGPIVSTSANRSGAPAMVDAVSVQRAFRGRLDAVVHGPVGSLAGPTPIVDLATGRRVR